MIRIGVVGDYQPDNETHTTLDDALKHAAAARDLDVHVTWLPTGSEIALAPYDGIWIAPGSPYRNFENAIDAIRKARTTNVPLLGTCAGFQHAVIEFARNVVGIENAHHAEYDTDSTTLIVDELACSLRGQRMDVALVSGSQAHDAYQAGNATERYYCRFGLNPKYTPALVQHGLRISGTDAEGEPRIIELPQNRFFVVTLFVPQTSSAPDRPHPLVTAFLDAASSS